MTEAIWDKNAIRVKLTKRTARLANVPLTMWFKGNSRSTPSIWTTRRYVDWRTAKKKFMS